MADLIKQNTSKFVTRRPLEVRGLDVLDEEPLADLIEKF